MPNQTGIPDGYSAIPILETELNSTFRLCVLARQTPDPAAGHLILLRDVADAMVYLGCVTDAGGRLHQWAEIWVQNVEGLYSSLPTMIESFSNRSLDDHWSQMAKTFRALNPHGFIETGWEKKHALPTFLDLTRQQPVHPASNDKKWELCQNDAALQAAQLPPYGTSLFRYLYQPAAPDTFIPIVSGAPTSPKTHPLAEVVKQTEAHIPLNPQGGLLMAQEFAPLGYEEYADLLSGKPWKGLEHGKRTISPNGLYSTLADWTQMEQSGAHLFLGRHGKSGRFIETFHLKLQLLAEAISAVRAYAEDQRVPFLNLGAESFRVSLKDLGAKLPFLWTAECKLVKPGQAVALPVETSDFKYFIRVKPGRTSIYQPEGLNAQLQGNASARLRKVTQEEGRTQIEGTLVMQERLNVSPHDLLWIRLPLQSGRVDLYGHLYTTEGMAQGEARFRTILQKLPPETVKELQAAEGVSFARSPFEVVPLLSAPCDMYALGVLAVRTFLTNPQNSLAEALDELMSLGRNAGQAGGDKPLPTRIGELMDGEPRFSKALGPHRLMHEEMEPAAAFELLPPELWHRTLAAIVRLFPGLGPDSHAKDFGDAPALAIEAVFNKAIEDFENLIVRSRSLIVIDWNANREVHSAIRDLMDRV